MNLKNINIQWLLEGNFLENSQAKSSFIASTRMRAAVTMEIENSNISVSVTHDLNIKSNTNIIGVGKIVLVNDPNQGAKWLELIRHQKSKGVKIFLDYTDHHLRASNLRTPIYKVYEDILLECDYVTTSSNYLEKSINNKLDIKTFIIEDPIEFDIFSPKKSLQELPTGFWFGHSSNIEYLIKFLQNEFNPSRKIRIIVMSNIHAFSKDIIDYLNKNISPLVELAVVEWSIENMKIAASISDFCIIPCGVKDERKEGVSSNRLITALALGLPCFADSVFSYKEFQKFYTPLSTLNIELFYINPIYFIEKTIAAQSLVSDRFSKKKIIKDWYNFLICIS